MFLLSKSIIVQYFTSSNDVFCCFVVLEYHVVLYKLVVESECISLVYNFRKPRKSLMHIVGISTA